VFERILVPMDFSKYSMNAIECINQFHDVTEVVLLSAIARDPNAPIEDAEVMLRGIRAKLDDLGSQLKGTGLGVKIKAEMLGGGEEIWSAAHRIADEEDVSLILMGAECRRNLEDLSIGCLSEDLLRYDDTHLMIIYRKPMNNDRDQDLEKDFCSNIFTNVLMPTDFSQDSRTAIFFVTKLKGVKNILLLHVIPEAYEDGTNSQAKIAMGKLNALAGELAGRDELNSMSFLGVQLSEADLRCRACSERLNITCRVLIGNIAGKILELAEKEGMSLIALSSSRNSNYREMRRGIAYEVAMTSCRPVLFVRSSRVPLLGRI
jgi:nucleotide-binding universal stress UspA family protein